MSASHKEMKSSMSKNIPATPASAKVQAQPQTQAQAANPEEERIAVNGLQQVLDMLRAADPVFRESLLKRLAAKDKELARVLRRDLAL